MFRCYTLYTKQPSDSNVRITTTRLLRHRALTFLVYWYNLNKHAMYYFTENARSWSKVGSSALSADKNEPTMVLNLHGMTKAEQRSMVLHEFGHALGLDHEHQRSDFWDVLEPLTIGKGRMKSGDGGKCTSACDAVFRAKFNVPPNSEKYDPTSIMHYW